MYYCQAAYDAANESDAMAAAADATDLAAGCGGFGWSILRGSLAISGDYDDNWGGSHSINAFSWTSGSSSYDISQYDNDAGWIVAQNGSTNSWNAGLWSKFEWTMDSNQVLYYCQSAYDAASETVAMAAAADANDLTGGCGGFGWSILSEQ
jgi:hypothetical protein